MAQNLELEMALTFEVALLEGEILEF